MISIGAIAAMQTRVGAAVGAVAGFVNLDAESSLTGWTTTAGTYITRGGGGGFPNPHQGAAYFTQSSAGTSTITQTVDIAAPLLPAVDAGVQFLEIRHRDRTGIDWSTADIGRVQVECLSAGNVVLAVIGYGEHSPTSRSWADVVAVGLVPPLTRRLRLVQSGVQRGGGTTDYYTDALAVTWRAAPPPLAGGDMGFVALDAETGTAGWSFVAGRVLAEAYLPPHQGAHHFSGGAEVLSQMEQVVAVPAARIAAVDAGTQNVSLGWHERAFEAAGDEGRVYFDFLAADQTTILGTLGSARTRPVHTAWTARSFTGAVPAGTRFIRLNYVANRTNGVSNDYYVDAITAAYL